MDIKGILLACLYSSMLYGMGLASGAYGLARGWQIKAEARAYEQGYNAGAKAVVDWLKVRRHNTPEV